MVKGKKKNRWWKRIWYIFHGIFRRCFYDEQYKYEKKGRGHNRRKSVYILDNRIWENRRRINVYTNEYNGIAAVVEITEVINEFTYYAKNPIVNRDIILDMEKDMNLKKRDRIYIEGSLQIELEEYKERLGLLEI